MKYLLALFVLLNLNLSYGGVLIEPYLGYILMGDADDDTTSSGVESDLDYNPVMVGARLGYQYLGLMAGFDISRSSNFTLQQDVKVGASETTTKYEYSSNYFGVFVGYNLPIALRAWLTYYLRAELEGEEPPVNDDELKGSGYGIGVGYTGFPIPFLSLNAEIRKPKYDESFDNSSGITSSVDYSGFELFLSVSGAFDL